MAITIAVLIEKIGVEIGPGYEPKIYTAAMLVGKHARENCRQISNVDFLVKIRFDRQYLPISFFSTAAGCFSADFSESDMAF
jgi:hypothetical protein